jgi:GTP-binding protein
MAAENGTRPAVAVVGFPNVGKSTLVNRLAGMREAVTHREPGVTRDRKRIPCEWGGRSFDLIDTGGIDLADDAELSRQVRHQAEAAMAESDAILLLVDGRAGIGPGDAELAAMLRASPVPVLVAVNKADRPGDEYLVAEFHALGLGDPVPVSATHGLGTGDLLDGLVSLLGEPRPEEQASDVVRVAVIGRPNVGKSSLLNAFLGSERVIVSERAGTTRDAIDTELTFGDRRLALVDTAGLRRRSKVAGSVDYYAQLRSENAVERADVAIVVCDAQEGITAEDLRIGALAMQGGCATLVALNKWDVSRTDLEDARARVNQKLRLRPPLIACSALSGRNVPVLLSTALGLADRRAFRVPTPELNRFVGEVVARRPPPAKRGRRLRLYYSAQIGISPPRFAIQVNDRRLIAREWAFHLENRLREQYSWEGVPLIIDLVPKRSAIKARS